MSQRKRPHLYLVQEPVRKSTGKGSGEIPEAWLRFPKRLNAVLAILELRNPERSQNEIADLCEVNRGSFSQWRNNKGAWEGMTVPVLMRLAKGLGVDPGWLLAGNGDPVWVSDPPKLVANASTDPQ